MRGGEKLGFALHVIQGRWFSLFASFLIMAGPGATYLFGIYSKEIKSSLGYDQSTLNLLGFFKDFGSNIGVLTGLIAEVTPTWFVLLTGSAMNFTGYFMMWLAVTGRIPRPKVWQMCVYICVGANSQNFANTGALVTCVKNFPENRGAMLGLLKGFVGLSGAVMTLIYLAIYGSESDSLLLLLAWLPAAISLVFVYTIRTMKSIRQPNELAAFFHILYVFIALAVFLMAITIAQKLVAFSHAAYVASACVVCLLILSTLAITIKVELILWRLKKQNVNNPQDADSSRNASFQIDASTNDDNDDDIVKQDKSCFFTIFDKPPRGQDYSIMQGIFSTDMLIIFLATFCGLGSSLTAVDNLGQIGESLGHPKGTINSFVSLVSIWNFFGRVFAGFVSESLLVNRKVPRPLMLTFVLILSCIGHLLIAFPGPASVYVASIIIGFSFGAQQPLIFAIISEIFGLKHYSTLFNVGLLASPLGSYILNVRVTGMLYDREALKELARKGMTRSSVKELTCTGIHCYRLSFIILAAVTFFGALASLILVMRTREFYKGDIYEKFTEDRKETQK